MALAEARPETLTGLLRRKSSGLGSNLLPDGNGNLRCMTALAQCDTGAAKTVVWTSFNMVSSVQQGTTNVALLYDESHARLQQSAPEGVTQYLNDPANGVMTERFAPTGGGLYWRSYIQADGHIVAERSVKGSTVTLRYFTLDHLGSTIALTDETGHLAESDAYDAWGKARDAATGADDPACAKPGQSFTTRGFSGHEEMADLCLVNMNARIYDPAIGRFMSPDDVIPDAFNGQSYNRYSYVDNNPLSYIDPTGHMVACTGSCFNYASAVRNNDSCTGDCDSDEDRAMQQTLQNMAVAGAVGTAITQATGQSPSGIKVEHLGGIYFVTVPGFTFATTDGAVVGGNTFAFFASDAGGKLALQIATGNADVGGNKFSSKASSDGGPVGQYMSLNPEELYYGTLKAHGIDGYNTAVPQDKAARIQEIMDSTKFLGYALAIYKDDVGLGKETHGIQVYDELDGDVRIMPYMGKSATCSSGEVACMTPPEPDGSNGRILFEWHPHPLQKPGNNRPSVDDLMRSVRLGHLPGSIWSNAGGDEHNSKIYQGNCLGGSDKCH